MRSYITSLLLVILAIQSNPTSAGHHEGNSLTVEAVWARATPGSATNGAVYLTIKNKGHDDDQLIKAHSDQSALSSLHTHIMYKGISRLRPVYAIFIPKMGTAQLKPGGDHIMLMGLKKPLKEGDTISLSLTFKKAGTKNLTVSVKKVGAMSGTAHHSMEHEAPMQAITITMHRVSDGGVHESLGTIIAKPTAHGVALHPTLKGLTPGQHGFHVHTNPNCGAGEKDGKKIAALQAGGHYDPSGTMQGHHGKSHKPAGDLPQIKVDLDGTATKPVIVKTLMLAQLRGRALMIHKYPENPKDPSLPVGGGPRFACGVIQ